MEQQITNRPTREDFIKYINDTLVSKNFTKEPEKETWIYTRDVQTGGQTIVINGQRHDQPGEIHHIKFCVEVYGNGDVKDIKTEIVSPFIEINFSVFDNDKPENVGPTFCIYHDDNMLFNELVNKIFKM